MKKVTYPNGVTLEYDDMLQIGDIITSYNSGYARVTSITPRDQDGPYTPLIGYKTINKADGTPVKGNVELSCDASYCRLAKESIDQAIVEAQAKVDKLTRFKSIL